MVERRTLEDCTPVEIEIGSELGGGIDTAPAELLCPPNESKPAFE